MVSVIIPVYNAAQYLQRCLETISRQTYSDIEIVLIDDGSTDESGIICDDYAIRDSRVKVYHQENQGASIARKNGIDFAKGEWLVFVDSDDIVEDDYLERLFNAINQYGVKIAACDQIKHQEGTELVVDKSGDVMLLDDQAIHDRFFKYQFWGLGGKIYHKSVFEGVYFPEYTINEDYVVMAQLFNLQKQMAYVPMGLYHYMMHEMSLSHQTLSPRMFDEFYNKCWVVDFYKKNNPFYIKQAEAQLTETCVKLLGKIISTTFQAEKKQMQQFLRGHMVSILFNPHLLVGLKVMALRRCF